MYPKCRVKNLFWGVVGIFLTLWYQKSQNSDLYIPNLLDTKKRFFNRETYSAAFCLLQRMSFIPLYGTQIINPFLNSMISANHKKEEEFQPAMGKSLSPLLFLWCTISIGQGKQIGRFPARHYKRSSSHLIM